MNGANEPTTSGSPTLPSSKVEALQRSTSGEVRWPGKPSLIDRDIGETPWRLLPKQVFWALDRRPVKRSTFLLARGSGIRQRLVTWLSLTTRGSAHRKWVAVHSPPSPIKQGAWWGVAWPSIPGLGARSG